MSSLPGEISKFSRPGAKRVCGWEVGGQLVVVGQCETAYICVSSAITV